MTETKRMPLDELRKTPEYARLTTKQKFFIDTYVAGGMLDDNYDAVAAANTAYPCKSEEIARVMSYQLLSNINIVSALNRHFAANPIDAFMKALDRAVHNKKLTIAQLGALRLQSEIMGFGTKIPVNFSVTGPVKSKDKKSKKTPKTPTEPVPSDPSAYDLGPS